MLAFYIFLILICANNICASTYTFSDIFFFLSDNKLLPQPFLPRGSVSCPSSLIYHYKEGTALWGFYFYSGITYQIPHLWFGS